MPKYALIGKNIKHSQSPQIYRKIIGEHIEYDLLDYADPSEIPTALELFKIYDGINITSPYKKHFLGQVGLTMNAESIGAINCLKKVNGKILAENTDYPAVVDLLKKYLEDEKRNQVIILGDGVMADVTLFALKTLGIQSKQYSRKTIPNFENLNLVDHNRQLIINTCSRDFIFKGAISPDSIYWDYNYSNEKQKAVLKGKVQSYIDGLELLHLQAQYAIAFWSAR